MKVLCVGYRTWALDIYDKLFKNYQNGEVFIIRRKEDYSEEYLKTLNPDIILFYGWSWIISETIVNTYKCIMLHPSKLPKYRGGSPIQNQIIDGETESAVTLFLMNTNLDAGPILFQKSMKLDGHIIDIFSRITKIGYEGTMKLLANPIVGVKQNDADATYCTRREKSQSEITLDELATKPAEYLYNKIRMLEDPYPNAFFVANDGKKILFKGVEIL
jgi:methionyl-tRNA formyltransferase